VQPSRKAVDGWLSSFWKRHFVLVLLPCMAVSVMIDPALSPRPILLSVTNKNRADN
jgi:hypothetical protein